MSNLSYADLDPFYQNKIWLCKLIVIVVAPFVPLIAISLHASDMWQTLKDGYVDIWRVLRIKKPHHKTNP